MAELAALAETAGSEVLDGADPAPATARPGDLHRLRQGHASCATSCVATGADTVICDGELTPGQLRKLEDASRSRSSTGPR